MQVSAIIEEKRLQTETVQKIANKIVRVEKVAHDKSHRAHALVDADFMQQAH